jgi:hypothetical protein
LAVGSVVALGFLTDYMLNKPDVESSAADVKSYSKQIEKMLEEKDDIGFRRYIPGAQYPTSQQILTKFLKEKTASFSEGTITKHQLKAAIDAVNNRLVILMKTQFNDQPVIEEDLMKAFAEAMARLEPQSTVSNIYKIVKGMSSVVMNHFSKRK